MSTELVIIRYIILRAAVLCLRLVIPVSLQDVRLK
jgi:hypothetical protein